MAFVLNGILGLIGFIILPLPLARAYLAGLASARDPAKRVTPQSPWLYFDATFWKRLKPMYPVWIIYSTLVLIPMFTRNRFSSNNFMSVFYTPFSEVYVLVIGLLGLAANLLQSNLICLVFAPFCKQVWTLTMITVLGNLFIYFVSMTLTMYIFKTWFARLTLANFGIILIWLSSFGYCLFS